MDYQPRTIAFHAEILHPPLPPDPRPVQQLHNAMFQGGSPPYSSFAVTPMGPVLSNPATQAGTVSQAAFLADRIQFREEESFLGPEEFAERVSAIGTGIAGSRGIPLFLATQVTLRSLISLRCFKDARTFLRQRFFSLEGALAGFPTQPSILGLRLAFPATPESPATWSLRIESWAADPRSLFIEVQGAFGPCGPAAPPGEPAPLEERVLEAYRFLENRALAFIARFDVPQEA